MSIKVMSLVWEQATQITGNDLLVLLALADWANDDGLSWHSVKDLARKARTSERTVQRSLRYLRERGVVLIQYGAFDKQETSKYWVVTDVARWDFTPGDSLTPGDADDTTPVTQLRHHPGDTGVTQYVSEPSIEPSMISLPIARTHTPEQAQFFTDTPYVGEQYDPKPVKRKGGKATEEEKTLPPTKYAVSDAFWKWAQDAGWRGDRKFLQHTADSCFDWYRGKGQRQADWLATLKVWIRRKIDEGTDLQAARTGATNGRERQGPGAGGPGANRPAYGYNEQGQATNRSTAIVQAARELAASQAQRLEEERAREDSIRDSPGPREQFRRLTDESDR